MTREQVARGLSPSETLALTLYHEAGGEGRRGMEMVAAVIARRKALGFTGTTWREVCLAPRQFSCWTPSATDANHQRLVRHAQLLRVGQRPPVLREALAVAEAAVAGTLPADVAGGADHYCTAAVWPQTAWAKGQTPVATHGAHVFFRLREDRV